MSNAVDFDAAAVTSLVLAARTLSALQEKGVLTMEEGLNIIHRTADEIAGDNPAQKAQCRNALAAVFPQAGL